MPDPNTTPQYTPPPLSQAIPKNACKLDIDLDLFEKYNSISAVYFLSFENTIVYVGMTKNLLARILGHLKDRKKVFDSIFYIETEEENLMILEKNSIENIKPMYNVFGVTKKYPNIKPVLINQISEITYEIKPRICSKCGKPFFGASHARYCSDACKMKAYRERKKRDGKQSASGNRVCAHCGTPFTGALYGRYCSNAHKQAAQRLRTKNKNMGYANVYD